MSRLSVSCLLLTLVCLAARVAPADDAAPAPGPAGQEFSQLFAQWEGYFSEIEALQKKYPTASADEKKAIEKNYGEVIAQVEKLAPTVAEAAKAAYIESPNTNENATKMVVGMAGGACSRDKYGEALETLGLLMENKCQAPELDDLAGIAAFCTHDFATAAKFLAKAKAAGTLSPIGRKYLESCAEYQEFWEKEQAIRAKEAAADDLPRVKFTTTKGDVVIELFENEAPQAVGNFVNLVEKKFYDGIVFHRVLPNFMAQGGCPDGRGSGGPGYNILCECYRPDHRKHFSGSLSMAHAGRDTGGSQFFLTFVPTAHLNGKHTVFGRVIEGMEVLADLERVNPQGRGPQPERDKIIKGTVLRKRNHEYAPTKAP
jgi:cyclophilin family peptidyl-prolyl cis-trans isomerase